MLVIFLVVATYVVIMCTTYNVVIQWTKLLSEQKYLRLTALVGHSIILNIILIVECCRVILL